MHADRGGEGRKGRRAAVTKMETRRLILDLDIVATSLPRVYIRSHLLLRIARVRSVDTFFRASGFDPMQ